MRYHAAAPILCAFLLLGCKGDAAKTESNAEEQEFPEPEPYACRVYDYYNYSGRVPWSEEIESSYFDDVLFAGDSRMGAMYLWGTIENAQVEYVTSLNLWLIDSMPLDNHTDGMTMYDALETTDKNNIYLLFGINEIRNSESYFDSWAFEQYQSILDMLRTKNPDCNIYIMSTYHPREISGLPEPALTEHLGYVNSRLGQLAMDNYVYYLDLDEGLTDESGLVRDEYVGDGLHFGPTGTHALEDYIKTHVVRRNWYVKEVCE
ncbi:MAG: hypothetical protein IKF60_02245 [Solobacterium sp.]|nr:hypothetical protein [Solobacterium sp.]